MRKDFFINSVGIYFVITHLFTSGKDIAKNDLFNKYIAPLFQRFLTAKKKRESNVKRKVIYKIY